MLKINFIKDTTNQKLVDRTFAAVNYEKADMMIDMLESSRKKYDKRLENPENYTKDEIEEAKLKIGMIDSQIKDQEAIKSETFAEHKDWVNTVNKQCKNEYFRAGANAARNVLRLVACGDNSRFFNSAILDEHNWKDMYEAFMRVHGVDDLNMLTDSGMHFNTAEDYVALKCEINNIMRNWFALPVVTDYTKPIKIKLNKRDLAIMHEAFVTGINVNINHGKNENKFTGLTLRTAINLKKNGEYEGKNFKGVIAKIAFQYICG